MSWAWLVAAIMMTCGIAAWGKQLYEFTDENGIRHFTDTAPMTDAPVKSTRIQVEERPLVALKTEPDTDTGGHRLIVQNLTAGPMEVELRLREASNITTAPPLPARFILATPGSHHVSSTRVIDPRADASFGTEVVAVPGDPRGRPDTAVAYRIPFASGTRFAISQAFGGTFSHQDAQNRHAVDLGVKDGTPVVAARDGIVIQVERDFYESGADRERLASRANYVRVMHEDDTMAVYAHLAFESVLVEPGDVVLAGQTIGQAGSTGFATGPHLHFVIQRNVGMKLESIPFRFLGPSGTYTPQRSEDWEQVP